MFSTRLAIFVVIPAITCSFSISTQDKPSAAATTAVFAEYGLAFAFPPGFAQEKRTDELPYLAAWNGKIGTSRVGVEVLVVDAEEYELEEPEDASDVWRDDMLDPENALGARLSFAETECFPGPFGWAGHVAVLAGTRRPADDGPAHGMLLVSGLTESRGWTLRLEIHPEPSEVDAKSIREAVVEAAAQAGPARDPKWKEAELKRRWLRWAPEATRPKLASPARSEHYVVLADCTNGAAFAKKLETFHAAVKQAIPFEELPSRRLLPVYLFRTEDEYYDYYVDRYEAKREDAEEKWGHREGIFYVTYFEDLDNPIHFYFATLQILRARLRIDGGGSWFAAGIAEYMSTKPASRNGVAKKAKSGEHIPFAELIRIPGLANTTPKQDLTGVDDVDIRFAQAALVIEFLRESKWAKDKFQKFVHTVGSVDDEDYEGIEAAIRSVYGVDLAGLEKQWIEYCKKR